MTTREQVMDDYLDKLHRSLRDIPASQREGIISGIVTHIDEALDAEPDDSEASLRNVLDRVDDPEEIASEARERLDIRKPRTSWLDSLAIVLLLLGGFLWLIGWIAGAVLLWLSDVWSTRQKIIGTLVVPGGLLPAVLLFILPSNVETSSCTTSVVNGIKSTVCQSTGGPTPLAQGVAIGLLVILVVAPILTSFYLGRTLMRARRLPADSTG